MLIEELCRYADKRMELPPPGYRMQAFQYVVDLDLTGQFQSLNTVGGRVRTKEPGLELMAPYLKRQGTKPPPVLLADKAGRALGLPYEDKGESWLLDRHVEYVNLVADCARQTNEHAMHVVASFIDDVAEVHSLLPTDLDPSGLLTFRVDGVFPFNLHSVRSFWSSKTGTNEDAAKSACAVCGELKPIVRIHPLKIKGVVGGQLSGTDLISANKSAWWSYGLENSLIFPTCYECAWKYANALNHLLGDKTSHLRLAGSDYVFWTLEDNGFSPIALLSDPKPQDIAKLLRAPFTGSPWATDVEDSAFFAASLRGSGARTCVRSWLSTTVGTAQANIAAYFEFQAMEAPDGSPSQPIGLWRFARALYEHKSDEEAMRIAGESLVALALAGRQLPQFLLAQAVQRCRASQGVTRERAALIKMALATRNHWSDERTHVMSGLDTTNQDRAYLCGRLLAELNEIQYQALGKTNATVIDKFYGSASSAPASVFSNLLKNARNHLSKLSKAGNKGTAAANALDRQLEEIMDGLGTFPQTLTMPEQAMFALGFYHQRAANRRAIRERIEARDSATTPDAESAEIDAA